MCTVSYLPGPEGFILTSSRDERIARTAAQVSEIVSQRGETIIFPKDPQGQGSWIASSATRTLCLLNGAFVAHRPTPPYRHSRGLVVLHAFDYGTIHHFADAYNFAGLESFTLILLENDELLVLRWDGRQLFRTTHDASQPRIWSSATLYTPEIIHARQRWFLRWLSDSTELSAKNIRTFHKTAGDGDAENAVQMQRGQEYATVSLTSVVRAGERVEMLYEDLVQPDLVRQLIPNAYVLH